MRRSAGAISRPPTDTLTTVNWTVTAGKLQSENGKTMFAAPPYLYIQGPDGVFPNDTLSNWTYNGTSICTRNASVDYCLCRCDRRVNLCEMSNREWYMEYLTPAFYEDQDVRPVAGEFIIYQRGRATDPEEPLVMHQWEKWFHVAGGVQFDPGPSLNSSSPWNITGVQEDPIKLVVSDTLSWVFKTDGDEGQWFKSDDEAIWEKVNETVSYSDVSFYRRTESWEDPREWDVSGAYSNTNVTLDVSDEPSVAWTGFGTVVPSESDYPIRLEVDAESYIVDYDARSQWWIRTDGEPSWEVLTENRNFTCETKCQLFTRGLSTMTCLDIPPGVVRVNFTGGPNVTATPPLPYHWCGDVTLETTVDAYLRGAFYERRALWWTGHQMDMLPVGGLFRFNGMQLTSRRDENTDDPLLVYPTPPDILFGFKDGLVVANPDGGGHWTISPAVDSDEAILEAPLSSLARGSLYLSKAFEFGVPRWAPFAQFWIELVPIATEFTRTSMRGGAEIYSLAVGKTPMFYDADYKKDDKHVPISLKVSMDCGWGQKPDAVRYHAVRADSFYYCYYRDAKITEFPTAEYFILRETPWYYVHMRGELALSLWFSDAYTATERPIHLLVACIEAMADDPNTAQVENAARVAIPKEFSFIDLELAPYVVQPENGTNMTSICPILHCPESIACSLAVFVQATAQMGYVLLRGLDILNIIDTYQQENLAVDLYPLACTTAQFSVGGGGIVASWIYEIMRMFNLDGNRTLSYMDDVSVGLSVLGRATMTYPTAIIELYSRHMTFKNMFEVAVIQDTIDDITPPVLRGTLFMMKECLGILTKDALISYADMNNFYEAQVKDFKMLVEFPGEAVAYTARTIVGTLSLFTAFGDDLSGKAIGKNIIMGRTPNDFYGDRRLSPQKYSNNTADAFVQYQFDTWGSAFSKVIGLLIGETLQLGANTLKIPFLKAELWKACHDEDASVLAKARDFFQKGDETFHSLDQDIENALNADEIRNFIGDVDEFTGMLRTVLGGLFDGIAQPLASGLREINVFGIGAINDVADWFNGLGGNVASNIPDLMKIMQDLSNYISDGLLKFTDLTGPLGLSFFTQDRPKLGWNRETRRFDETRVFSTLLDFGLAPHNSPLITQEWQLWSGAGVIPGIGLSNLNAEKLLESTCAHKALLNTFKGGSNSAPALNIYMNANWDYSNVANWQLPDGTPCQRTYDIDFGPTAWLGLPGVTRFSYATPEAKDENSIIRAIDNITEIIFQGVRDSCGLHGNRGRRRLLSIQPQVPWLEFVNLLLEAIEGGGGTDPRSTCDARLLRARAMGVVGEEAKVCALKRTVYLAIPDELLTMPVGYYYDDAPFHERLYTYRHDVLNRVKRRASDATETWRGLWSPRPGRAVTRTRRARDVDDLWNDVLIPRIPRSPMRIPRRRLLGTGDDCLTCAVWDDIRTATLSAVDTAANQYAMIVAEDPHMTSKQMQAEASRLARATHANGWRYMEMDDVIPYRVGHWIHESLVDASTFNFVHFVRACPMADMMNVTATDDGLDRGIALAATFGAVIFAISTPALLAACKSMDPVAISLAFAGIGVALYYVMSVVFLWTTYDVPITCNVPYPMIPFNMWDDLARSFTRWIPGCMCSYFPLLIVDEQPCDARCGDRDYSYYPCVSVVDDFGLIWSLEYPLNYFITGVLEFREPGVPMTPYDRTEHSCWLMFTAANAPLMFIFASAFFVFLASCVIILLIVLFMSVQAHLHLLRGRRTEAAPSRRGTQMQSLPRDRSDSQFRLLTKKTL